jgi:hypothetical protein
MRVNFVFCSSLATLISGGEDMKNSHQQLVVAGAVAISVAFMLSRNPNCNKGCNTLAY